MGYGVGILGMGKHVPTRSIPNAEIEKSTGLPEGTILDRLGIRNRRVVDSESTASGISVDAARMALDRAKVSPEEIKLILGCTFSPDYVTPAMACKVHQVLGTKNAFAFDILANCTAFQIGLGVARDRMIADPTVDNALVLGTAIQSRFINWTDPNSAPYFGDGAGAAVLGRVPEGYGILANENMTQSAAYEAVRIRGGGSSHPLRKDNIDANLQYYELNGIEVWKQVVQYQPLVIRRLLEKAGKQIEDVDFFIFHQANLKLIEFLMGKMRVPMEKTFTNVTEYGNTGEASMAIALCEAVEQKKIQRGNLVVISGVGAGFTFGATLMRWY